MGKLLLNTMKYFRPVSEIEKQIAEFKAIIPTEEEMAAAADLKDFATELQTTSWKNHLADLEKELEESRDAQYKKDSIASLMSGRGGKLLTREEWEEKQILAAENMRD